MSTTHPEPRTTERDGGYSLSRAGATNQQPAILVFDAAGRTAWTFSELEQTVGRLAAGFQQAGLQPDQTVALLAFPSPAYIATILAVFRAGATVVPVDAQLGDEALVHILADAQPRWLFTDERGQRRLDKLAVAEPPRLLRLDQTTGSESWRRLLAADPLPPEEGEADQRAVLFYTSGTTGAPKGVPLSRRNLFYQLDATRETGLIQPGDRMLLPLPLHHVYPFVVGLLAPVHFGLTLILPAALTGPQLVRAIREGQASIVLGVPRLHRALVDGIRHQAESAGRLVRWIFRGLQALSRVLTPRFGRAPGRLLFGSLHRRMGGSLRLMASGGSPLDPQVAAAIKAFGWDLAVGYGLTETSPLLTILLPHDPKLDTVGRAVPGTELRIDRSVQPGDPDDAAPRKNEQAGEVQARGPGVFAGYHRLPDATEQAFTDGWFRTGDVGWFDADGFLHLEGRVSTMLVLEGGENVAPEKLEELYEQACDEIQEIGILQQDGKLAAVIVPRAGLDPEQARATLHDSLHALRDRIPSYQRLSDFKLTRRELPRTRLGKIRRQVLAELYASDTEARTPKTPIPVDEMSADDQSLLDQPPVRALWDLLAKRFADRRLEPESRLQTDLGIDSLGWVELSTAIEAETGLQFGDEVMEAAQTVHDLLEAAFQPIAQDRPDARRALTNPESVLRDEDRRWIQPRTALHRVVGGALYVLHQLIVRGLFRVQAHGLEHLPDHAPYVLAPNHVSYLDPSALIAALRRPLAERFYWAGLTDAMFHNAALRCISRIGQVFPIDPRRGPRASLALGAAVLKRGDPLVWFPEGKRSPDGQLLPFRPGLGLILQTYPHVPVVPVYIDGADQALPVGHALPRPRRITVHFGRPVLPADLEKAGEGKSAAERMMNGLHAAVAALRDKRKKS